MHTEKIKDMRNKEISEVEAALIWCDDRFLICQNCLIRPDLCSMN